MKSNNAVKTVKLIKIQLLPKYLDNNCGFKLD